MLKKHITHTIMDPGDSFNASTKALLPPKTKNNQEIKMICFGEENDMLEIGVN